MKTITPYLIYLGQCREAMAFYQQCLGGGLHMMTYREGKAPVPDHEKEWLMHARLVKGSVELMASDASSTAPVKHVVGNNFYVTISTETIEESERLFKELSAGGKIEMPIQETFWAIRFGMFTDKFGINWMINQENKPV